MNTSDARREMAKVARLLYERGLIAGSDGNVSVRLAPGGPFLVTPSGVHKGMLAEGDILLVDEAGNVIGGEGAPTSEYPLHRAIYRKDPDAGAIVHAHPPWTLALFLTGWGLQPHLVSEARILLGDVALVPYVEPGGEGLAQAVAGVINRGPVQVLAHHGAVARAPDLEKALSLMECLEHTAKITALARLLGNPAPLPL